MAKTFRFFTIIVLSILVFSCSHKKEETVQNNDVINKHFLGDVQTEKAILSDRKEDLTLTGEVECDPNKTVNYTPLVNGVVMQTYRSLGDKVKKGQTLMDIKSTDLSELQTRYASLKSELKVNERELKAIQSMYHDNMSSERDLYEAKSKVIQTMAEMAKTKGDMGIYGANKGGGVFSIKAPASGYIINWNVSAGSTIVTGGDTPAFVIADLSTVWVMANVYSGNLMFVKPGMNVFISTYSYPGEIFKGKINNISQTFDSEDRVLKARIVMQNKGMKLKPQMAVIVKLENKMNQRLIAIPSNSLIFDNNKYYVVIKEGQDNFKVRNVITEGHNGDITYISYGLKEGEDIVVKNQLLLYSGLNNK